MESNPWPAFDFAVDGRTVDVREREGFSVRAFFSDQARKFFGIFASQRTEDPTGGEPSGPPEGGVNIREWAVHRANDVEPHGIAHDAVCDIQEVADPVPVLWSPLHEQHFRVLDQKHLGTA